MIHFTVVKTKLDGTQVVETDTKYNWTRARFFTLATRQIPVLSGIVGYRLKKDGVAEFKNQDGETIRIEAKEVNENAEKT